MSIRKWIAETSEQGYSLLSGTAELASSSVGYLTKMVGDLKFLGSTRSDDASRELDERHYFLIPDRMASDGYSLVVTRCLPEGVPPINNLPKSRTLHLPNENADAMLRKLLIDQAKSAELDKPNEGHTLATRARDLADAIDALDGKVFGGVLLVGGLVALFNPVAGAAIAAKSLLPSLGMLASKYGLRVAEDSLSQAELKSKARSAEKEVLQQFRESNTSQRVDEVLQILELALRTDEDEYDPMLALHNELQDASEEQQRLNRLSAKAILDVYSSVLANTNSRSKHSESAGLGSEDQRFLSLLQEIVK